MNAPIEHSLPCEGCGEDVVLLSTGEMSSYWADGMLVVYCPECWNARLAAETPEGQ